MTLFLQGYQCLSCSSQKFIISLPFDYRRKPVISGAYPPVIPIQTGSYTNKDGLYGFITEIRDGEEQETENDTPDIYCVFVPPILPYDIAELEKRFAELYLQPKMPEDISLNEVIMAPGMIKGVGVPKKCRTLIPIYAVVEDWAANGERGIMRNSI